jgi:hypothetical protein
MNEETGGFICMYVSFGGGTSRLPGLPDGIYQAKNQNFVTLRRTLQWKMLVYFAIWYILCTLVIFCGNLVYFSRFGTYILPRKIWQPCSTHEIRQLSPHALAVRFRVTSWGEFSLFCCKSYPNQLSHDY